MAFGHNANWFIRGTDNTPHVTAKLLLEELLSKRRENKDCFLVLVGHSFGGIIIEEASNFQAMMSFPPRYTDRNSRLYA
jgi:hypothetical protein